MSRPPVRALEQIKHYCEKTQCRRCEFAESYNNDDMDFVGCKLQSVTPCDWEFNGRRNDDR